MSRRILFVDDDVNLLSAFQRNLRRDFDLVAVSSPEDALHELENGPPFGAIVSDLKMPRMNGIELLTVSAERWPDTVRILLTGEADTKAAINAVNHGHVYRFLMKPLALTPLTRILTSALAQYNLIVAERELLERTLSGSVKVLTEVLELLHPLAFSRTGRMTSLMKALLARIGPEDPWEFEMAAMLSLIGCIAQPDEILRKVWQGEPLSEGERLIFNSHPATGARLLQAIPRLESVCQMIERQEQKLEQIAPGVPLREADRVLFGAYLLKVCSEFDSLTAQGLTRAQVLDYLQRGEQSYPPALLDVLAAVELVTLHRESRTIKFRELGVGMMLQTDILSRNGLLLLAKGSIITLTMLEGLARYSAAAGIQEPIQVLLPSSTPLL